MTSNNALRVGILDCDGTLVDSHGAIVLCLGDAFTEQGLEAPAGRTVRQVIGLGLEEAISRLLPDDQRELTNKLADDYRAKAYTYREQDGALEPLYPGVYETVAALAGAGWLLGVATSKSLRGLTEVIEQHGLSEYFVTLQTPDNAPAKPNPEMLFRALSETGADATQAVMIGDTTFDMEMAAAAGVAGIGVAWGYHEVADLKAAGASAIAENIGQLPTLMAQVLDV